MRTRTLSSLIESLETRTLLSSVQPVGTQFALGGTPWSPDLNYAYATYYGHQDVTDAGGNILAKWIDPSTKTIFLQSFHSDGTPRTAPFNTGVSDRNLMENIAVSGDGDILVNDDPAGDQGRTRLAIGANGDFMVAFESGDFSGNGQTTVYGQAFLADGTRIGSNFVVGTNDGLYLDVAAQPNDSFAVIWGDHHIGQTWGQVYQILA